MRGPDAYGQSRSKADAREWCLAVAADLASLEIQYPEVAKDATAARLLFREMYNALEIKVVPPKERP